MNAPFNDHIIHKQVNWPYQLPSYVKITIYTIKPCQPASYGWRWFIRFFCSMCSVSEYIVVLVQV